MDALLKDKKRLSEILVRPGGTSRRGGTTLRVLTRPPPRCLQSFHVCKGKTLSKYIINGSGQMPTLCELPDPKIGAWKVVLCVDEKDNGKNGKPLVVGQKCATVQGLAYEVRACAPAPSCCVLLRRHSCTSSVRRCAAARSRRLTLSAATASSTCWTP